MSTSDQLRDLREDIQQQVMSFLRKAPDGNYEVPDMRGFVDFIVANVEKYLALLQLVRADEASIIKHIEETGEVPPGVKAVRTRTVEGSNVTKVDIFHGPAKVTDR